MSRFADRVRLDQRDWAGENCGHDLNAIARSLWEQADWRRLGPEQAAERWLAERAGR